MAFLRVLNWLKHIYKKISIAVNRAHQNLRRNVKKLTKLKLSLVYLKLKPQADSPYTLMSGLREYRGGCHSSARETDILLAAGAFAKTYLAEKVGIVIR